MSRPKHATASVFFYTRAADGWRIGLITHPRFGKQMLPGGHVEDDENPAEAAVREVTEETGLPAYLVSPPGIGEPAGAHAPDVSLPLWIVEQVVPPETRCGRARPHRSPVPGPGPRSGRSGARRTALRVVQGPGPGLDMFDDTRVRALHLFARLTEPAGPLTGALHDTAAHAVS